MSAGAILRAGKLKGPGRIRAAAAHNLRAIQAELGGRGHIDASRSRLNVHLAGPIEPRAVAKLADDRMASAGISKLRRDAVRALEFVVSLPVNANIDEGSFFDSAMHWLAERFGGVDNILSADVHRDESAPHMHLLLLPLFGGRMAGSDALGGPAQLKTLQSEFFAAVCEPLGLKRYPPRLSGDGKRSAAAAVLRELERRDDPAQRGVLWPLMRDRIAADPAPFAELLGIATRAPAKRKRSRHWSDTFISPGKGPKREPNARNPIGFASRSGASAETEPYAL